MLTLHVNLLQSDRKGIIIGIRIPHLRVIARSLNAPPLVVGLLTAVNLLNIRLHILIIIIIITMDSRIVDLKKIIISITGHRSSRMPIDREEEEEEEEEEVK